MDRAELERLDRESLVLRAQAAGIKRARVLTRPELVDELVRLDPQVDPSQLKRTRGFFGLARDLLSRVVERGLHLPDAAERFRAALVDPIPQVPRPEAQAIPTVTLAEIYAAQGHKQRAIDTLQRVLEAEPDHGTARALMEKLQGADYVSPAEPLPPEPEVESLADEEEDEEQAEDEDEDEADEEEEEDEIAATEPAFEIPASPETPEPETPRVASSSPVTPIASTPIADRCVAIGPYVWWQLSPRSHRLAEESFFFIRVVVITPSWDGPEVATRDLAADPSSGELVLGGLPLDAIVRIAIGFMPDGEFVPVAHSPALERGPAGELVQWSFDGEDRGLLDDPQVRAADLRAANV